MVQTLPLVEFKFYLCFLLLFLGVGTEVLEESSCVNLQTQRLPVQKIKTYIIWEGAMRAVM